MMRALGTLTAAILATTPVMAQDSVAPMPTCDPARMTGDESLFEGYGYTMLGEGFAYYERFRRDGARWELIVEHCDSRDRFTAWLEQDGVSANHQIMNDASGPIYQAIQSDRAYTLRDLARIALPHGAQSAVSAHDMPSCVCRDMGY